LATQAAADTELKGEAATLAPKEAVLPIELPRLYRYLHLETFTEEELGGVFDRIHQTAAAAATATIAGGSIDTEEATSSDEPPRLEARHLQRFFLQRYSDFEQEFADRFQTTEDERTTLARQQLATVDAESLLQLFQETRNDVETIMTTTPMSISRDDFVRVIREKASVVDMPRTLPITASMLLVGASVGVITPAMPFVVESLSLTTGQYGLIVSGFGLAKMAGNIPSAIAVERHGRKPYLTYSLAVVAMGVGGIGMASSFEELYLCRLLTGLGVAALSTAGTMTLTDLSTPLNRASTMAPVMSAFAAGTALGPALGGMLVDQVGLQPTFYMVGVSYLGVAVINKYLLNETKNLPIQFSWQRKTPKNDRVAREEDSLSNAVQDAVSQWLPLLKDPQIRNVMVMHGLYWVALAGAQMTLLPLILTDADGLAMSATQLGSVYMGMSLVQIFGNPLFAGYIDRIGKVPAIIAGCTLISSSMMALPFCHDVTQLAGALGVWSIGSSMLSTAPLAYVSDQVDESKRAQAIALLRTCGDVGFLIGASGAGALADWTGSLDVAMHSSAGLLFTATGWFATRQYLNAQLASTTSTKKL
jgi:MFS family permease